MSRVAGECFEDEYMEKKKIYIKRYEKKVVNIYIYIYKGHDKTRTKDV